MKLMAFDVDGTLSEHGTAIHPDVAAKLKYFETQGIRIALVSGKPAYYLAGLARGMGLSQAKLIGENGCVIFDSGTLDEIHMANRHPVVDELEKKAQAYFKGSVWFQPNRIALTIFPKDKKKVPVIAEYVREQIESLKKNVMMYEHVDAVDIVPVGVDKGTAMRKLMKELQLEKEDIIAFGDSENDLPMFEEAGTVIMIGKKLEFKNAFSFNTIEEALDAAVVSDFINR
jgi:HAD superfamily hydrolase (TIGR01484 family)